MTQQAVLRNVDARGVATVTLNRPEVNNAYDETLIGGLHEAMAPPEHAAGADRGAGAGRLLWRRHRHRRRLRHRHRRR
jgi:hypothetical protein